MQVLKEDVRQRIKSAALTEFKSSGFKGASVRRIADSAQVSVGNLYCYFSNKESLFEELVAPVHAILLCNINHEFNPDLFEVSLLDHLEFFQWLSTTHYTYQNEFYILLERSDGTRFEGSKEIMTTSIEALLVRFISEQVNKDKVIIQNMFFAKAFAVGFIEGLLTIMESSDDNRVFIENMIQYTEFTIKSMMRTLISLRDGSTQSRRISDEEMVKYFGGHCHHSGSHLHED